MEHGFVKVAAATPQIRVGDCEYNAARALECMNAAAEKGVRILVLPELCLTGYTCGDLFLQRSLLSGALKALGAVIRGSRRLDMLVFVGLPMAKDGSLYNCAAVVCNGVLLGVVPKSDIPNYGEFYELRLFTPAPAENSEIIYGKDAIPFGSRLLFKSTDMPELCVAAEICEDLWSPIPPSSHHALAGATVICNLSASDEVVGKDAYRRQLICGQSARLLCGYIYADAGEGESTTDVVYAAHNIIAENGVILSESRRFTQTMALSEIDVHRLDGERRRMNTYAGASQGYRCVDFSLLVSDTELTRTFPQLPFVPDSLSERESRCEDILTIAAMGLKRRVEHSRADSAVVGLSGGLDSTLALLVTVRAFDYLNKPRESIVAVTMPGFGTTGRTKGNAERLAELLGVTLRTIPIGESVKKHFEDIGHDESDRSVVYENAQARERTQVLMDIANQTGGLVVGTGDLSELALGWATYNGDHMSMYGVNAGIPKTLVRHIVDYCAHQSLEPALRDVLLDILATPVSPELLPPTDGEIAQKTEELVGPYELHDFYLYYAVRWGFPPSKILRMAKLAFVGKFDERTISGWLKVFYRRFFAQQFKRSCLPDGPKVGSLTLSPRGDWRMPSDASAELWLKEISELI